MQQELGIPHKVKQKPADHAEKEETGKKCLQVCEEGIHKDTKIIKLLTKTDRIE